jgi:hypothetical protein
MQLHLKSRGRSRRFAADRAGIAHAWSSLLAADGTLAALDSNGQALFVTHAADGLFRFRVIDHDGPGQLGLRRSARRDHDAAAARRLLEMFVAGDAAWRGAIAWRRGVFGQPVAILGPATILICVVGYFAVAGATGGLKGWSWRYLPNLVVGLVMIGAIFAYADWFLRRLRARLAAWLGGLLGLRIVESQELGFFSRPGMWESADGGLVSSLKVTVLDFTVLILGLVIPIFAIGTVIVLAARPILA